ncbi:HAMP domain-containing histidine kinase [Sulfurimonas sp. SAG-AH-194-C20]|nr:HAMP domain-containing sensor histidine kinase [Sulfurimonas sp. SAG-AH-194-C20]MDF1878491.1 HAMP domain-containing histidine kinase [Sulfurimonas sp. SAG-AH-194-C20]
MLEHEKTAFWKFFSIYFGSVALLILAAGYFYFGEQRKILLKNEHFAMIEHVRKIKMNQYELETKGITHTVTYEKIPGFTINNFSIGEKYFESYLPYSWEGGYYIVHKDKTAFHLKLSSMKKKIIVVQVLLLILFGVISFLLSRRALKPMQEAITTLDNFSKDLIHDLNTPVTSILLNTKILEKNLDEDSKPLMRIKTSAKEIGELHNNLTILLQEETMIMKEERLFDLVQDVVSRQEGLYPEVKIELQKSELLVKVHADALKQVLSNILSNACKYNKKEGHVKIYTKNHTLYIQDSGLGIAKPENIFDRNYKEQKNGHGIGLDIVKRLCDVMEIEIWATSVVDEGTLIGLKFKNYK